MDKEIEFLENLQTSVYLHDTFMQISKDMYHAMKQSGECNDKLYDTLKEILMSHILAPGLYTVHVAKNSNDNKDVVAMWKGLRLQLSALMEDQAKKLRELS